MLEQAAAQQAYASAGLGGQVDGVALDARLHPREIDLVMHDEPRQPRRQPGRDLVIARQ